MAYYSIYPFLRTDKPIKRNNKYPIYLRVRIYDQETKLPSNLEVAESNWNQKRKEPKDSTLRMALSSKILSMESFLNTCISNGSEISVDVIKAFMANGRGNKRKNKNKSFYDYYLDFVERKKATLHNDTILVYMNTYKALKSFRTRIDITDIDLSFIEEFDKHLRDVNGNSNGGRTTKHQNLKTVILDMIKHDIQVKNPYPLFKIPTANVKEVYLEKSELERFEQLYVQLPKNSTRFKCLEMYLFSCYCGLRISDVVSLKWSEVDLENGLIIKRQVKTKAEVKAPVFDRAKEILQRKLHEGLVGEFVFGDECQRVINIRLKELAKMAGIDKHLTFHSSRHTFATLLVMDGVSIYKIQKFLGHKSVNMTERYLKYDLKVAQVNMEEIETFS